MYVTSLADTNAQYFAAIIWCWTLGGASDTNGGKFKQLKQIFREIEFKWSTSEFTLCKKANSLCERCPSLGLGGFLNTHMGWL